MHRSEDRILTTHAGSLPRPAALVALLKCRLEGQAVSDAELDAAANAAVHDVIDRQIASGIDVGNDGEQRRLSFARFVEQRLSGFGGSWHRPPRADIEDFPLFKQMGRVRGNAPAVSTPDTLPQAIADVHHIDPDAPRREIATFLAALREAKGRFVENFITAPSPGFLATTMQNAYYDSENSYLSALGEAMRIEYEAIVSQGLVLQIDCPDFGVESGRLYYGKPVKDYIDFVDKVVATINNAVRNIPKEQIRLHVCWGNSPSPRNHDIELEKILPSVLRAKAGAIMLPFANGRHAHEYKVLEKLPLAQDQILLAGVIDTLTNVVEHPETVADRIERVAAVIGDPRRIMASTDCGLETSAGGSPVAADVAWAKLKSLSEGARIASRRLFR